MGGFKQDFIKVLRTWNIYCKNKNGYKKDENRRLSCNGIDFVRERRFCYFYSQRYSGRKRENLAIKTSEASLQPWIVYKRSWFPGASYSV